ncbi:hypothetical protein TeGR_g6, partial [Tetraparma gracilis]
MRKPQTAKRLIVKYADPRKSSKKGPKVFALKNEAAMMKLQMMKAEEEFLATKEEELLIEKQQQELQEQINSEYPQTALADPEEDEEENEEGDDETNDADRQKIIEKK